MRKRVAIGVWILSVSAAALPGKDHSGRPAPGQRPATAETVGTTLSELQRQSDSVSEQLGALGERARVLEAFTVLRGRAYVRLARAGLMPIGGGFSSLVDHAARLERLRKALARDQAEARAISSERQRLAKKLDELEARRELLEGERDALERSHAVIAAAKERELAFRRAFESSYEPDHTAVYSGSAGGVEEADVTAGFSAMRGRLSFPISGRAEIREARRGNAGPGLEMVAPLGSAVRAMFPGRVAFVDAYPSFGTTVIIDHGGGYFSVNAGFSEVSVTVGREVTAGQILGRLGPSGVLYVEIRKERQTLEPAPWFGI